MVAARLRQISIKASRHSFKERHSPHSDFKPAGLANSFITHACVASLPPVVAAGLTQISLEASRHSFRDIQKIFTQGVWDASVPHTPPSTNITTHTHSHLGGLPHSDAVHTQPRHTSAHTTSPTHVHTLAGCPTLMQSTPSPSAPATTSPPPTHVHTLAGCPTLTQSTPSSSKPATRLSTATFDAAVTSTCCPSGNACRAAATNL